MLKKIILAALLSAPLLAQASTAVKLDSVQINVEDKLSLQRGARTFVNYCVGCHSAGYMRYSRLEDLGLTEKQIVENLMVTGEKPVETMTAALRRNDAKEWFGVAPPDLTVIARSRGADWLYTYLRSFYRDPSRPTGWNNTTFPSVAMPHALWDLQGEQVLKEEPAKAAAEGTEKGHDGHAEKHLALDKPGKLSPKEYDAAVKDLVNYMVYMGEPGQTKRKITGIYVLFFLFGLTILAYFLKKEFWKDIH
jgi:ubiquinol-cytochrome c reductase cytochrome c1 subunit